MNPKPDYTSACLNKKAFDSFTLANQILVRNAVGKERNKDHRTVYKCNTCNKYHLGTRLTKSIKHEEIIYE